MDARESMGRKRTQDKDLRSRRRLRPKQSSLSRIARSFYVATACLVTALILVIGFRSYSTLPVSSLPADVDSQLRYLSWATRSGAAREMQGLFPEGFVFTNALYGLALVEVGRRASIGSSERQRALQEARWAYQQVDSDYGKSQFHHSLPLSYGVFYRGWRNWLQAGILTLQAAQERSPTELKTFRADCRAIAAAFRESDSPFLESYRGAAWPGDNMVAIASLAVHDQLGPPLYQDLIHKWLQAVRTRLDKATGLVPHSVDARNGAPRQGARGSSQALMLRFLAELDPVWAAEQYRLFRKAFVSTRLGFVGVLEYPVGTNGESDVDSGPLLLGFGPSATVVAVGAARVHGDAALVDALAGSIESVGMPVTLLGKKRYGFGLVPVADAFLLWAKTTKRWTTPSQTVHLGPLFTGAYRRWHSLGLFAGILAVLWGPVLFRRRVGR